MFLGRNEEYATHLNDLHIFRNAFSFMTLGLGRIRGKTASRNLLRFCIVLYDYFIVTFSQRMVRNSKETVFLEAHLGFSGSGILKTGFCFPESDFSEKQIRLLGKLISAF